MKISIGGFNKRAPLKREIIWASVCWWSSSLAQVQQISRWVVGPVFNGVDWPKNGHQGRHTPKVGHTLWVFGRWLILDQIPCFDQSRRATWEREIFLFIGVMWCGWFNVFFHNMWHPWLVKQRIRFRLLWVDVRASSFLEEEPKKVGTTNSAEEDDGGCRGIYASLSLVSLTHKWLNYYRWGQPILEYFNGMFLPFFYIFTSTLWLKIVKFK